MLLALGMIGIAMLLIPLLAGSIAHRIRPQGEFKWILWMTIASICNVPIGLLTVVLLILHWAGFSDSQHLVLVAMILASLGIGYWWIAYFYPKSCQL